MTHSSLSQNPVSFPSENHRNGSEPNSFGDGFTFTKIKGGYEVLDGENIYEISKPNGKIVCDCPEFKLASPGTCDHIAELIERFGNGANPRKNQSPAPSSQPPVNHLPSITKSKVALGLEHPFRDGQIKSRAGKEFVS